MLAQVTAIVATPEDPNELPRGGVACNSQGHTYIIVYSQSNESEAINRMTEWCNRDDLPLTLRDGFELMTAFKEVHNLIQIQTPNFKDQPDD